MKNAKTLTLNAKVCAWMMAAATVCMLTGCKTKVVTVPEVHTSYARQTDTAYVYLHDSIYRRDSVFTTRYTKGDTVYQVAHFYHFDAQRKDRIAYRTRTDTLLRTDSISVPYPVVTERKVVPGWVWKMLIAEALAAGAAIAVWWYRRNLRRR